MRYTILLALLSCAAVKPVSPPAAKSKLASITPAEIDAAQHHWGCRTECGMYAPLARNCDALRVSEQMILESYATHVKGWTEARMCKALKGVVLYIQSNSDESGAWTVYHNGQTVRLQGLTLPKEKVIIIGTELWDYSALAHEMGHIFDIGLDLVIGGHHGWTGKGLCAAINEASFLQDDCGDVEYMGLK